MLTPADLARLLVDWTAQRDQLDSMITAGDALLEAWSQTAPPDPSQLGGGAPSPAPVTPAKVYHCDDCGHESPTGAGLAAHRRHNHPDMPRSDLLEDDDQDDDGDVLELPRFDPQAARDRAAAGI